MLEISGSSQANSLRGFGDKSDFTDGPAAGLEESWRSHKCI